MSWRRNRMERPPRVGAAVLAKALAGVFTVFIATTAGVAGAGYLQIQPPAVRKGDPPAPPPIEIKEAELPDVEPGGPRTLLVLGSDRRAKNSTDAKLFGQAEQPHSDTIVLVRLDPKRNRIAVMSLPRDLAVTIPGYADGVKINQAYDEGGAALTLNTVKNLFQTSTGHTFPINSVIDVNFLGFQEAVNYVHGVYVDVDRRYYNPEGTGFAAIDVEAGYQRLVGSDALAYVRYRHGGSDIYRNARQQDFLRQAAAQRSVRDLKTISQARHLLEVLQKYFRFDKKFLTTKNLAGLLKTGIYLAVNHAPVNQIKLTGITESENPTEDTRLFVGPEALQRAYADFMTGEHSTNPERSDIREKAPSSSKKKSAKTAEVSGLVDATRQGQDMAVLVSRKLRPLPFYFPAKITSRSQYVNGSSPRVYKVQDEDGKNHK